MNDSMIVRKLLPPKLVPLDDKLAVMLGGPKDLWLHAHSKSGEWVPVRVADVNEIVVAKAKNSKY